MTGKAENSLTQRIEEAVVKGRKNEAWRTQYMKEWVIIQDAKEEGREEGREEIIINMFKKHKTAEEIADLCGLQLEEVKNIQNRMLSNV